MGADRGRQDRRARCRRSPTSARTCAAPPAARCWCRRSPSASPARAASSPSPTSRRAPPTSSIPSISATSITAPARMRRAAAASERRLDVSHDAAGDWAMTQRFCARSAGRSPAGRGIPVALRSRPHVARRAARFACACRCAARRRALRRPRSCAPSRGCAPRATRSCCWSAPTTARRRSAMASISKTGWRRTAWRARWQPATWRWRGRALRRCSTPRRAAAPDCWASSTRCDASRGPPTSSSAKAWPTAASPRAAASSLRSTWRGRREPIPTAFRAGAGWLRGGQACAASAAGQHGGWGPDETRPFLMVKRRRSLAGNGGAADQPRRHRAHHCGLSRTFH